MNVSLFLHIMFWKIYNFKSKHPSKLKIVLFDWLMGHSCSSCLGKNCCKKALFCELLETLVKEKFPVFQGAIVSPVAQDGNGGTALISVAQLLDGLMVRKMEIHLLHFSGFMVRKMEIHLHFSALES